MIRFVAAALWIVGVTIGTIMFAFSASGKKGDADGSVNMSRLEYLRSDMISIPVIRDGDVQGYFLTRLVYAAEPEELKKVALPIDVILVDEIYTYLFSNPMIDFSKTDSLDIETLRNGLRDGVNKRIGHKLVEDVMVQQIDYLSRGQIRDNALKRRGPVGGENRPVLR
jgi:CBS domain-containing protein